MKKTFWVTATLFVVVIYFAGVCLYRYPVEPSYENKSLSAWLAQLDYSYRPQDMQASNAVFHMSTNILPFLCPMLRAHDSRLKLATFRLLSKQSVFQFTFMSAEEKRQRASRACRVLGTSAEQFLPELVAMLDSPDFVTAWCGFVAIATVKLGARRIPELTKALTNIHAQVRSSAAGPLANLGREATSVTSGLIERLNDTDAEVRINALNALVRVQPAAAIVLSALNSDLKDKSPKVRQTAAVALARVGKDDEQTRTELTKCLNDEDAEVRSAARFALQQLQKGSQ